MNPVEHNAPPMTADESPAVERELARAQAGDAVEIVPATVTLATLNAENQKRWDIG